MVRDGKETGSKEWEAGVIYALARTTLTVHLCQESKAH